MSISHHLIDIISDANTCNKMSFLSIHSSFLRSEVDRYIDVSVKTFSPPSIKNFFMAADRSAFPFYAKLNSFLDISELARKLR